MVIYNYIIIYKTLFDLTLFLASPNYLIDPYCYFQYKDLTLKNRIVVQFEKFIHYVIIKICIIV